MKNSEISTLLGQMADLMEIDAQDSFRIGSYRRAAISLLELAEPVESYAAQDKLTDIPGIGKGMAEKIQQYLKTGKIEAHEELIKHVPATLVELLRIQGTGPKTVAKLWKEAGITSMDDLRRVLAEMPEKITDLKGMSTKKVEQLQAAIAFVETTGNRMTLGKASSTAAEVMQILGKINGVRRSSVGGSLRRGRETVGDLDFLVSADPADARGIIEAFTKGEHVRRVLAKGDTKGSVVLGQDVQADLRVVEESSFGSALAYFTGSKAHNVRLRELAQKRGWKLNEYGLFDGDKLLAGVDESGIYKALGMDFVPPELREDRGEIQAALEHHLPRLVELQDIRGDFHMHTSGTHGGTGSDGTFTIDEMIDACRRKGYKYLAITDHSQAQHLAHGLDAASMRKHLRAIREAAGRHKDMLVLAGGEVDILKDGRLDFDDDLLAEMDFVIASPHLTLKMDPAQATARLIKAVEHPHVRCLGHPSGRLINERPGMDIDIDAIAQAAAANHVAMEVNSHYLRLDLRDTHVRAAIDKGCRICINTDAHTIAELEMTHFGVTIARRGWATAKDVINTWSVADLKAWLKKK